MRIRVPDQWWGDYLAMIGSARVGEREMLALVAEVGIGQAERLYGAMVRLQRAADGRGHRAPAERDADRTTRHDAFGHVPEGIPIKVEVDSRFRSGFDHDRPSRQSGLPAVRPQPVGGVRAHGGDDRGLLRCWRRVPPNAGFVPAAERAVRENCSWEFRGTRKLLHRHGRA